MFLFLISFIAGVLTVLAPCILPLLPVIVGGSLDGKVNLKKASTVVVSLGISVIAFTFILKVSTLFIAIPEYTWKIISGGIILLFGIITLFPSLWENKFLARLSRNSNILLGAGDQKKSFLGDIIVGSALGPVFTTCSPTYFIVLATVLPVTPVLGLVYLLAYTLGLCLSLLCIAFIGQKMMVHLGVASNPRGTFKKILGILFIIVGLAILSGADKALETKITNAGFFDITKVEQKLLNKTSNTDVGEDVGAGVGVDTDNTESATSSPVSPVLSNEHKKDNSQVQTNQIKTLSISEKKTLYKLAPELSSIDGYINTDGTPVTLAQLRGKVVLLDIWTYSCINCQRTLPYLNDWYAKYKDQGLVIVGLHTPEFGFEKIQANVEKAVEKFGIKYPVVLDNDYSTWRALGNNFWPRKYLIDIDGYIIYDHIGEGGYIETEQAIQKALQERAVRMNTDTQISTQISAPAGIKYVDNNKVKSSETYFGSARNATLANGRSRISGEQTLTLPIQISPNYLYLGGVWNFTSEYAENKSNASIVFNYDAKNVYMAAGSDQGVEVEVYKDDVFVKKIMIKDETLYTIIDDNSYGQHILKIIVPTSGLKAFTFTFG